MAQADISNKGLAARVRELAQRDGQSISADHVSVRRWLDGTRPKAATQNYIALALGAKLGRRLVWKRSASTAVFRLSVQMRHNTAPSTRRTLALLSTS